MRWRILVLAIIFLAGCAGGKIRDDFVAGWQSQRDVYIARYVHPNFAQQRRWATQRATLVTAGSLDWPSYARPALATAIRAQALAQDRGRALVLEHFLEHMRTTPSAEATAAWFGLEATNIEDAAIEVADRSQALVAELSGAQVVGEDLLQRIEATAASRGVVRGRALQHADLRRTARLYFRARDDEVEIPGDDEALSAGTNTIGVRQDPLIRDVNRMLETTDLRAAILRPRRCTRGEGTVICTPEPVGAAVEMLPEDDGAALPQPADSLTEPVDNASEAPTGPRWNFDQGQAGW